MKKIPTLFERIYENHKVVGITDKLSDERLQVVLDGKCIPTVKIDGSCCAVINGKWYKRYDAKAGKKVPEGAIPCQDAPDQVTGHWPHWVELNSDKAEDKWYIAAFNNYKESHAIEKTGERIPIIPDATYEAIGPHFQGNPYNLEFDTLYRHGIGIIAELQNRKLNIDILREYLNNNEIEGIVFWYNNEPLCKIKRSDFGFEWPVNH